MKGWNLQSYNRKKKRLLYWIYAGMVVVLPAMSDAQMFLNTHKITVEEGLSQNSIQDLIQDNQGFLWFGTSHGLNRYDGRQFVVFHHQERDKYSLSHSWIAALLQSRSGEIWIGTADGLNVYDPRLGRVIANGKFPYHTLSLPKKGMMSLFEDSRGWIWIGTRTDGVYRFEPETKDLRHFPNILTTESNSITQGINVITEDRQGRIWFGTDQGLSVFNPQTALFQRCEEFERFTGKSPLIIREIYPTRSGDFWIGTHRQGLVIFDPNKQTIQKNYTIQNFSGLQSNHVLTVHEDRQRRIWVGTQEGGLYLYDASRDRFQKCEFTNEKTSVTGTNTIMRILEDSSGVLWFATNSGGLIKYSSTTEGIMTYRHLPSAETGLSHNDILRIFEDSRKKIWIATYGGGINVFNPATNEWEHFHHDKNNNNSISYDYARAISEDKEGNIWIGTFGNGLDCYNPKTKKFTHYKPNPSDSTSLNNNYIWATLVDKQGRLWIGSDDGAVAQYYPQSGAQSSAFRTCKKNGDRRTRNAPIQTLYQDSKGKIWVGTMGDGLLQMDVEQFRLKKSYYQSFVDTASTSMMNVVSIIEDSRGFFWIGTYGAGLIRYNDKTNQWINFTDETGLPNNVIYGVLEDMEGNIWVSTNLGVARLHCHKPEQPDKVSSYSIMNYDMSDGLQSKEFNRGAYARLSDGRLAFGGVNGFNLINPQKLGHNGTVPKVVITNVKTFNTDLQADTALSFKKTIELDFTITFFSITFSALEFTNPAKNRFKYRMIGLDTTWITNGFANTAIFTNLDPGTYQFYVIACNNDGVWNKNGVMLEIVILPPVWKTWWFRTVLIVFVVMVFIVWYKARMYSVEQQNKLLSLQVAERTKEIHQQLQVVDTQAKEIQLVNGALLQKNLELERSNTLLEQADKYKTMVISMASHDLKNPLSAILGFTDHIKSECITENDLMEAIQAIENSARRMYSLIKDLLDMSAIEMGKMSLQYEECNLGQIVVAICESYGLAVEKKQQHLNFTIMPDCITDADGERLVQVFDNLISNCVKYTPQGGQITVHVQKTNDHIIIEICDTGPGFTEEDLQKMFGFFQQLSAQPTGDESSTGVGLAITKQIVELHDGQILVQNNAPTGAKFTVLLPIIIGKAGLYRNYES